MTQASSNTEAPAHLPLRHSDGTYTLGWMDALLTGVESVVVYVLLSRLRAKGIAAPSWPWWAWVPVVLVMLGQWLKRTVVVIDHEGVRVQDCWWLGVPVRTKRWGLDACANVYQSWESEEAEGIEICGPRTRDSGQRVRDSGCIGPAGDVPARALADRMNASVKMAQERSGRSPSSTYE